MTTQVDVLVADEVAQADFMLTEAPSGGEGEGEGEGPVKGGCAAYSSDVPGSGPAGDIVLLAVVLLILGSRRRAAKQG